MRYVILGGGIASLSAVMAIRSMSLDAHITLVTKEPYLPYRRPMITSILEGTRDLDSIQAATPGLFRDLNIELILGDPAVFIDNRNKRVSLMSKKTLDYDRLFIGTGASPVLPEMGGVEQEGVLCFRAYKDALRVLAELKGSKKVVVVGAGPMGIKLAITISGLKKRVTLIELKDQILPGISDRFCSHVLTKKLSAMGIGVLVGEKIVAIESIRGAKRVILEGNVPIETDILIMAAGVRPDVFPLQGTGVAVNKGILVDEYMQSNDQDIFAGGDVAECTDMIWGKRTLTPIWPEAIAQGETAGYNMAGGRVRYEGALRRNVMQVADMDFLSAGHINPTKGVKEYLDSYGFNADGSLAPGLGAEGKRAWYRKLLFENGRLIGFLMLNHVEYGGLFLSLMRKRLDLEDVGPMLLMPGNELKVIATLCKEAKGGLS